MTTTARTTLLAALCASVSTLPACGGAGDPVLDNNAALAGAPSAPVASASAATGTASAELDEPAAEAGELAGTAELNAVFVPPSINPDLAAHTNLFVPPKVYQVGANVFSAVGYGLANIIMVVGTDGVIIVDTGVSTEQAQTVWAALKPFAAGRPVKGVIYTHHHIDHVGGASAFVSLEDAHNQVIPVVAHESLVSEYAQENVIIGEVMGVRAASQYNSLLPPSQTQQMNSGIGPVLKPGTIGFVPPNSTFSDQTDLTIAGVAMHLVYVPSEANSEIAIYLPTENTLLSAEVIQDHTFPNLYTLRGANFRNPRQWYQSIDKLRQFGAENMVPQHGPPVYGATEVATVLQNYRDGIQFVHDQTLRFADKGYTPDELVQLIHLPPHLANIKPWLQPFYGSVEHSVPQIYNGYLGWFDGDPVALHPTPTRERAKRLVALMGGRQRVLSAARNAYTDGDYQWSTELATELIHIDRRDTEARDLKSAAFKHLGYAQINANWRGLYLTAADVLDRTISLPIAFVRAGFGPIDNSVLPMQYQLLAITTRLRAELTLNVTMSAGFDATDTGEVYTALLRRGIVEIDQGLSSSPSFTLHGTAGHIGEVLDGKTPLVLAIARKQVTVTGSVLDAVRFFAYFELRSGLPPNVFVR